MATSQWTLVSLEKGGTSAIRNNTDVVMLSEVSQEKRNRMTSLT